MAERKKQTYTEQEVADILRNEVRDRADSLRIADQMDPTPRIDTSHRGPVAVHDGAFDTVYVASARGIGHSMDGRDCRYTWDQVARMGWKVRKLEGGTA